MKGNLTDLSTGMDGRQRLTISIDGDARSVWDDLHDGEVDITIKRYRPKRSLEANAYCWVLIDKLAARLHLDKLDIYREAIKSIGGVSETVCVREKAVDKLIEGWQNHGAGWTAETMPSKIPGCVNVTLYYGSSTYDRAQMGALIDHIVQDCKAVGIETENPANIRSLLEQWEGR